MSSVIQMASGENEVSLPASRLENCRREWGRAYRHARTGRLGAVGGLSSQS